MRIVLYLTGIFAAAGCLILAGCGPTAQEISAAQNAQERANAVEFMKKNAAPLNYVPEITERRIQLFQLTSERVLGCRSVDALMALSAPDAKERLGDLNYARIATAGDCVEYPNSRPVMVCYDKAPQLLIAQYSAPHRNRLCRFVDRKAVGRQVGEAVE